nr:EOG090X037N [Cyclestheria hislopi]
MALQPSLVMNQQRRIFRRPQEKQMSGTKAAPVPGVAVPGKGGKKSRYFNQRWANSSTQQLHYCEVCKISCASPQTYKDHLEGQKHKKKEAAIRTGMPLVPTPRTGAALHCELCNVTCTSSDAYAAHIRGTKHQKVVKLHTKLGKPIPPPEPQLIHASKATTSVTISAPSTVGGASGSSSTSTTNSSTSNASKVVAGGNYLASAGALKGSSPKAEPIVVEAVSSAAPVEVETDQPMTAAVATETALSVVAQWEEEKNIQPVGQDYVEELRGPDGKVNGFNCRLCDCRFNDVNAKDMHLKGRRHRLMYKKKVDPSLVVESKGWPAQRRHQKGTTWQDRKKKSESSESYWEGGENYEELPSGAAGNGEEGKIPRIAYWPGGPRGPRHGSHSMGLPPPPQYFPAGPMPMGMSNPAMRRPESNDDRHILAKHADIYPSDEELDAIQNLVSYVERALKLVSDELANQAEDIQAESSEPANQTPQQQPVQQPQPQRILKGVMRVGLLAKGLLLKGDRIVHLVVLCSQPPTHQLLDTVAKALPVHLAAVASSVTFNVEPRPADALVDVKAVQGHGLSGDILVQVSLTSPVVREEQLAAANGTTEQEAPDTKDRLSSEHCLQALAQLRRAKWFQARANSLQNCVMIIRVMRDFCLRSPIWANMDFWAMELLVERAIYSAGMPLSPGDAFRRVFETLSAGMLLTSTDGWSPGIADPCEKDVVDACANLTAQEREDITAAAQHTLRLIAFRQIFKVLGMSKPLPSVARFKAGSGPSPGGAKKRPRENSQSEIVGTDGEVQAEMKKEKIEEED